jgi:hypothetical protein
MCEYSPNLVTLERAKGYTQSIPFYKTSTFNYDSYVILRLIRDAYTTTLDVRQRLGLKLCK